MDNESSAYIYVKEGDKKRHHKKQKDKKNATTSATAGDIPVSQLIEMTKKRNRLSEADMETDGTDKKKKKKNKKSKKSKVDHNITTLDSSTSVPTTTTTTTSIPSSASLLPTSTTSSSSTPSAGSSGSSNAGDSGSGETDPFPYLEEDCCETQSVAYENIANLLDILAQKLNKTRKTLRIYDPYFCEGAMIAELNTLGFMDVYNRREDFYAKQERQEIPEYDVLITNPPYSGDHVEHLLNFCIKSHKPYFLLMPNYVYMKPYYLRLFSPSKPLTNALFYVTPPKRLLYTTPKGRRQQKSGKFTSPFPTFWYCYFGQAWAHLTDSLTYGAAKTNTCNIARRVYQLPVEVLTDSDPRKKKERDKIKRAKNKARKKAKNV